MKTKIKLLLLIPTIIIGCKSNKKTKIHNEKKYANKEVVIKIPEHEIDFNTLVWLGDDHHLLAGNQKNNIIIWDVKSAVDIGSFGETSAKLNRILFTPDNQFMVTSSATEDGTGSLINVYSATTKEIKSSFTVKDKTQIISGLEDYNKNMVISPDGKYLVLINFLNGFELYDLMTGNKKPFHFGLTKRKIVMTHDSKFIICSQENIMHGLYQSKGAKYQLHFYPVDNQTEGGKSITHRTIPVGNSDIEDYIVSPDGKYLAASDDDGFIYIWDLEHNSRLRSVKAASRSLSSLFFTAGNEKMVAVSHAEGKIFTFNLKDTKGLTFTTVTLNSDTRIGDCRFSPSGNFLAVSNKKSVSIYKTATGRLYSTLQKHTEKIFEAFFSKDGNSVITARHLGENADTNQIKAKVDALNSMFASKFGGKSIIKFKTGAAKTPSFPSFVKIKQGNIRRWDMNSGEVICDIGNKSDAENHNGRNKDRFKLAINAEKEAPMKFVTNLFGVSKEKYMSLIPNGSSVVYLIDTVKRDTFKLYTIDDKEWIIVDKKGYFWSSPNASAVTHYIVDGKAYSFSQFDLQFNRPDKILAELGLSNEPVIKTYRDAVLARWVEMNIDTNMFDRELNFNTPETEVILPENFNYTSATENFKFKIKARDEYEAIELVNIWINGVPVYGKEGLNIFDGTRQMEKELDVKLTPGANIVEVAVLNGAYMQSFKERFEIDCLVKQSQKPKLYLVTLGVSQYDDDSWTDLKFAAKDAADISDVFLKLKNNAACPYSDVRITNFKNEEVTEKAVLKLKDELLESSPEDYVIVFYSGHGIRNKNKELMLGTTEIGSEKDDFDNGLPFKSIENLVSNIPARQKLVMVDACESGRINPLSDKNKNSEAGNGGNAQSKGSMEQVPVSAKEVSAEKLFTNFLNLTGANGATIICAASGDKSAYEEKIFINGSGQLIKNGVFTYCILDAVNSMTADLNKDNHIDLNELKKYVVERTKSISDPNHPQDAMSKQENMLNNWIVK